MEAGDILVVTKLDRLGRDAMDVSTTVANIGNHRRESPLSCPRWCGPDQLHRKVDNGRYQYRRGVRTRFAHRVYASRTQKGKAEDTILGRPPNLSVKATEEIVAALQVGTSLSALAGTVNLT